MRQEHDDPVSQAQATHSTGQETQAEPSWRRSLRRRRWNPMYEGPSDHVYGHRHVGPPWAWWGGPASVVGPGVGMPPGGPPAGYPAPVGYGPWPGYGVPPWAGPAYPYPATGPWVAGPGYPGPWAGGFPYQGGPWPWGGYGYPTMPGPWPAPTPEQARWQPEWIGRGVPGPGPVPGPYAGVGPRGYERSDEQIREDVCDALMRDPQLDASGIEVRVERGVVTLTGMVHSREDKRRAEDDAWQVAGVQDVSNELRIQPAAPAPQPATTAGSPATQMPEGPAMVPPAGESRTESTAQS